MALALALLSLVAGTGPQCKDALIAALARTVVDKSAKCEALRVYAMCVNRLGLGDAAERLYIDNAVVLVDAECTLPPEIVAKDGNLDIAVDGMGQVTLTRRTRSTIDLWDLHDRVNDAATTSDVDTKISTQNMAINTINANIATSLTQNVMACTNLASSAITTCSEKTTTAVNACQGAIPTAVSQARTSTDSKMTGIDVTVSEKLSTLTASVLEVSL